MYDFKYMKKYLLLLLFFVALSQQGIAQQETAEYLVSLKLPPIDTLFESVRRCSIAEFYDLRKDGQELALKTERRRWLENISLFASYQYGIIGLNSYTDLGSNYPTIYQYSGREQLWYNVGASLNIPLDRIFDRRNRVKTQKIKVKEAEKEGEMAQDEQKLKIIEFYSKAQAMLGNLKIAMEAATLANADYALAEKDYVMGAITSQSLNTAKSMQTQTIMQMENVKAELYTALMKLEVLSKYKILAR